MPPRYAYWTIVAGGLPTAFRATDRDDLLPTFRRILQKHPDAVMFWFARGRLWESPDAAKRDLDKRRATRRAPTRTGGTSRPAGHGGERTDQARRSRDWRPGGDHRDPRQPFKDAKKDRNQRWRSARFARKNRPPDDESDRTGRPGSTPRTGKGRGRPRRS